ncbi:MAG: type II secretion system protein [Clostridiales bacterium]|nr:type II secretion system GspH family protein [Roseburia sp.]MDD7638244.1 type II secretion system protein [Clostridiales bacterium]MDY4114119.1 type II secretion system protein [Roseburia sp.]
MFNRQNKKDRRKGNNKGFSLVELIVVIAIMAVLVAVLAPQFTKYIDQSRKSNDAATVSGIVTAAQVGIADLTYAVPEDTYTITIAADKTTVTGADVTNGAANATKLADAIKAACGDLDELKITSKNWKDTGDSDKNQVRVVLAYTNGAVTVSYSPDFESYVAGN